MIENRLGKADVIAIFSEELQKYGFAIELARSKRRHVDLIATNDGVGLFVFAVGEVAASARKATVVRETAAAFLKAAEMRGVYPLERVGVVAPATFSHQFATIASAAQAANIELWLVHSTNEIELVSRAVRSPELVADCDDVPLKRWPQDYVDASLSLNDVLSVDDPLFGAIVFNDEFDDERFDLYALTKAIASGRQTLSFGGIYISRSTTTPGACMLTIYEHTLGDFPTINAAIAGIRQGALRGTSGPVIFSYREYTIAHDRFNAKAVGVYLRDNIVVASNQPSQEAAVRFIRKFIEDRRDRITDNGHYR